MKSRKTTTRDRTKSLDDSPESRYATLAAADHRKRLGQYFTPPNLAHLMADWVAGCQPLTILDPSLGTGILARAAAIRNPGARLVAYEIDNHILQHAAAPNGAAVINQDFLQSPMDKFDAIIMNPPYIRHRELSGYDTARAQISVRAGYVIPKSANLYIYFATRAAIQLNPGGRAAILIPAEWMNANFSKSFKGFMLQENLLREVVLFSGCSSMFSDALTTASVLFLEKAKA